MQASPAPAPGETPAGISRWWPKDAVGAVVVGNDAGVVPSASVLLRTFPSIEDPMVQKWIRFRNAILGDAPVALVTPPGSKSFKATSSAARSSRLSDGVLYWRLVASNNRELGRSAFLYQSVEHARRHVERIMSASAELTIDAVADRPALRRGWVLSLDAAPVMTSARWYSSSSTSVSSAMSALAALQGARVLVGPARAASTTRLEHDSIAG